MPRTKKEAGTFMGIGAALFVLGLFAGGPTTVLGLIGIAVALFGAVVWLIHHNAEVRQASQD